MTAIEFQKALRRARGRRSGQRLAESYKKMLVTPEMAAEWLETNDHNRPQMSLNAYRLTTEIRNGRWVFNGETIKFDWNGVLLDGQHRLLAIVASGIAVDCLVVWGLDPECFPTIDAGSKRTAGHHLATMGKANYNTLGSAISYLVRYERGALGSTVAEEKSVTGTEVVEALARYPEIEDSLPVGGAVAGIASPSMAVFFHYVFSRIDAELADRFWEGIATGAFDGVGLHTNDPAYVLRDRLLKEKMNRATTLNQRHMLALIIKAWNKTVAREPCSILRWGERESFPEIVYEPAA